MKTIIRAGRGTLGYALSVTLVVAVVFFAASCGNSENGPLTVSSLATPVAKTVSRSWDPQYIFGGHGDLCWSHTSIAIDPGDGCPAIAFYGKYYEDQSYNLMYAKYDGSDWEITTVDDGGGDDVGGHVSLAFDSAGCPSIAYYNATDESLLWVYDEDDDGDWDDDENWPYVIHPDVGTWAWGDRNVSHKISGYYFGFAFYDENYEYLRYFEYNIVTSNTSLVEPDTSDDVGRNCSLHLSGSTASVSYYDATNGYLKFAKENSPYWDVVQVDDASGDDIGRYSSLSYKSSSVPTIAYYNADEKEPWLAIWNPQTSEWGFTCLHDNTEAGDDIGKYISHDWDPITGTKGGFSFLHQVASPLPVNYLKFVYWNGEDQTELGSQGGMFSSFTWKDGDTGWISHQYRYSELWAIEFDDS